MATKEYSKELVSVSSRCSIYSGVVPPSRAAISRISRPYTGMPKACPTSLPTREPPLAYSRSMVMMQ